MDVTECVNVDDVRVCWGEDEILDRLRAGVSGLPREAGIELTEVIICHGSKKINETKIQRMYVDSNDTMSVKKI